MLAVERHVARHTDAHLFVSAAEAKLFRTLAPEVADRTTYVENGVDTGYFDPDREYPNPYPPGRRNLVFTGAMDYWPNVDAVVWFATDVLPLIREQAPDVDFSIVGARPAAAVGKLQTLPGVQVIGAVKEMRPWLAHADVAVAPLRIARGIQNKVLEAMSMARAVVVTPEGLDGIDAEPGTHLEMAANPEAFATAVLRLLDPLRAAEMGVVARALMQRRFAWQHNWDRLQCLLQGESLAIRADTSQ
jgi:sugar transferase (PEP-CTERM/EpsH1 system associated)